MPFALKKTTTILFVLTVQVLAATNLDSLSNLLQRVQQQSNHQEEIDLLNKIGEAYTSQNDLEKALSTFEKARALAKKTKDWPAYETVLINKAQTYMSLGQNPQAIETLSNLIEDLKPIKGSNLSNAYAKLAEAYRRSGNNDLAYEYNLAGLQIFEEEKDTFNIVRTLYSIGSIFFYQDNYELALEYFQKTLSLGRTANLERYIFSSLCAMGGAYNRMGQTKKSLEYNQQAYELGKRLNIKSGLPYAVMNLGANYAEMDDIEKALIYYKEALSLNRENNDTWGECGTLRIIGDALIEKKDFENSIKYLNEALAIAEQHGFRPRKLEVQRTIADYYEKIGDYKLFAEFIEKYALLKDTLANEDALAKMSESKTKYEILQKEKELALKDAKFILQQRTFLLLGICILSICLWLLVTQNRLKAKNNRILAQKNKQIKKQNEELATAYALQKETNEKIKEQNRQLEQSNIELKRFAFIASHDLKEPLRTIGSYANLLQRRYKDRIDENANEFLDYITGSAKRLYTLLNDVLDYSKLNVNKKENILTDANEAIQIANENLKTKIANKNAQISIGELPKLTADKLHLVQLFQNLIDNSIKYSESQQPVVEIASTENNGFYEFSIKDNGIGIDPELQPKIFEMFKRLHTRDKFEGNGIGLAICKKIVQEYGGEIWVESAEGKGSTFYFTLPVPEKETSLAA